MNRTWERWAWLIDFAALTILAPAHKAIASPTPLLAPDIKIVLLFKARPIVP
ncbi:MAG: hypothetical protein ABGX36_06845 [Cycloclasticus sp.]